MNAAPWSARFPVFPALSERIATDVCVVGAGAAGLTTALLLRAEGRDVVLLEAETAGSGESGRATGRLSTALDTRYCRLEELQGGWGAHVAAESHARAIERIEEVAGEEGITCGLRRVSGYLFAARPEDAAELERERGAAQRAGLWDVEVVPRVPEAGWDTGPALHFPHQARLDPARWLAGLARAFRRRGGRLFCGSRVEHLEGGVHPRVVTREGRVDAEQVVLATHTPFGEGFRLASRLAARRAYAVALRLLPRGLGPDLLQDTAEPRHDVRTARGANGDLLLVAGEEHDAGHAADERARWGRLVRWARARFPVTGAPVRRWSGTLLEPEDGLAFVGRDPDDAHGNVFVVAGTSGNGLTYGMVAAEIFVDELAGRRSPWGDVYAPARHPLRAAAAAARYGLARAIRSLTG